MSIFGNSTKIQVFVVSIILYYNVGTKSFLLSSESRWLWLCVLDWKLNNMKRLLNLQAFDKTQ